MDAGTEQGATPEGQAAEQAVDVPLSLDDEIVELKKLLEDDPEDFQAQCRLGEVYFAKGMLDEALENVSKAITMAESIRKQMDHSLAMYYANRGTIQATKGDMDEAMSQFRKALEINSKDVLALFNLGRALFDRDEYMEAMPLLERLVDVTPFGARLRLSRPTESGRLLHLTLPMPRPLRCFDHVEDQYRVWCLVRYVKLLDPNAAKGALVEIGVVPSGSPESAQVTRAPCGSEVTSR